MRWSVLVVMALVGCGPVSPRTDGGSGGGLSLLGGGFGGFGGSSGGGLVAAGGSAGGGSAGGASAGGTSSSCGSTNAPTFTQLHGTFSAYSPGGRVFVGGFDAPSRRGFAFPQSIVPSLQTLHTLRLDDAGTALPDGGSRAFIEPLPVRGTVPSGELIATSFDEQTNVLTGVYLLPEPFRFELATLTVSNTEARFATLTQANSPDAGGFGVSRLEGTSSVMGAQIGNEFRTLSVSGTQATWGPAVSANVFTDMSAYDRTNDRVFSIGKITFTPPSTIQWTSELQERPSTSPSWATVPMSGMGVTPFNPNMSPMSFVAYDSTGERLLVAGTRPMMFGGMTVQMPTALEANLRTHQWRDLGTISSIVERQPFFFDRAGRSVFASLTSAYSLAPGTELQQLRVPLTGTVPSSLSIFTSAARVADGRVLTATAPMLAFNPATNTWEALPAVVPPEQRGGASIAWDPVGSRALLLFGLVGGASSNKVSALSADGKVFSAVTTTGTVPSARSSAGVLVVGNSLVVVGGIAGVSTMLGDAHVLDLTTLTWRSLGTVTPRANAGLAAVDGAVMVVGGRTGTSSFVAPIERIDLTSGTVQPVSVSGPAPTALFGTAPFGSGLAGFDIGDTIDTLPNSFVEVRFSNGQATWTRAPTPLRDAAVYPTIGVAGASCNEALFVGPSTVRVTR